MSLVNDALKQAAKDQMDKQVIAVPRQAGRHQSLFNTILFLLVVAAAAAATYGLNRESSERRAQAADFSRQVSELTEKHDDLMKLIQNDNGYLDTRLQLEVLDLRADLRALTGLVDTGLETQVRMKDGLSVITKRLHNVERDHSILAERLEAIKSENAAPAEMAAP